VAACAKHFVGDGGTVKGRNGNDTQVSYRELVGVHMRAYRDAIRKGVSTVMASYSCWNGVKMHAHRFLLTRVLKEELGFKGFVISDYMGIDQITDPPGLNFTFSVYAGIHAGLDMVPTLSSHSCQEIGREGFWVAERVWVGC
jgi:beta-glucosidase